MEKSKFGKQRSGKYANMKIGDLVRILPDSAHFGLCAPLVPKTPGIVLEFMEDGTGYELALVYLNDGKWWIYKSQLVIVNDV
jgi:hypothetical protein